MATLQNSKANDRSDIVRIIVITVKLLVISVVSALLLAVVNDLTKEKIAENIKKEKEAAIQALFQGDLETFLFEGELGEQINEITVIKKGETNVGYAAEVESLGFGGPITIMVGIKSNGDICGVRVISHSETAGLGSRVSESKYLDKYKNVNTSSIENVDSISGATISSKAVRDGVKLALSAYTTVYPDGGAQ